MADFPTPPAPATQSPPEDDLARTYGPLIVDLRSRRLPMEQSWLLYHSAWRGKNTRSFFKSELFNHFVPAARRSVEKFTIRGAQMLVPSAEFFEVFPADEMSDPAGKEAEATRAYMVYLFTKRVKPYPLVRQLLRSYALYGRAIAKSSIEVIQDGDQRYIWPTVRPVDPFAFYVWPETVTEIDKAQVLVEDSLMPWDLYEQNVKMGLAEPIKLEDLVTPEWPSHHVQRLADSGITEPSATQPGERGTDRPQSPVRFVALSEVWVKKGPAWEFFWLVWNSKDNASTSTPRVVRYTKRKFPRSAYRMAIARDLPGEHYTTGMMDDLEPLQVLLNDQVNMTLEQQATNFSPIAVIDQDMVGRASSIVFRPRAKWLVKPEGVKFLESAAKDSTRWGYQGIQFTMGLMDSFSGSNSLSEGTPTRNMPRAGFAISSLLNLSMADIKDAAQVIEDMILSPLLGDVYRLTLEFVPPTQIMKIPGTQHFPTARRLTVSDLSGDWEFKWVGSLQASDFQVRAQRLVASLGLMAKLGPVIQEDLMIRGKRVNWEAMLKRLWRDGLGERGADSIIEDIPPQELFMIQAQRLLMAQAKGEAQAASEAGMKNAAKGGGGGRLPSAPNSAEGLERQASRGMSVPEMGGV